MADPENAVTKVEASRVPTGSSSFTDRGLAEGDSECTGLNIPSRIDTDVLERETGFGWGWFMVLGAVLIVLGGLAFLTLPPADAASIYATGIFILMGAFAQLGTALLVPRWRGIGLLALSAVFYGTAGIVATINPTLAATALSVLLALGLLFSGITRILLTAVMPPLSGRAWVGASGSVSAVTGLVFMHLSLGNTVWLPGIALAADLTFQGAMVVGFALASRRTQERLRHR